MTQTNLDVVEAMDLPRWNGDYGARFIGIVVGMMHDMIAEASSIALLSPCCTLPREQPNDAVDLVAADAKLQHYPGETYDHLRQRVLDKWDFWSGNPVGGLLSELDAAFPGVPFTITTPQDTALPMPAGWWSAFWLNVNGDDLPVKVTTPGATVVDGAIVGQHRIGPTGIDTPEGHRMFRLIESIIAQMKPVNWVCWNLRIEIPGSEFINLMIRRRTTVADPDYEYHET